MIPVLFTRHNSIYQQFADVDYYNKHRDARTFAGSDPVIAHPPCRAWGGFRFLAKPEPGEKELAIFAVDLVRKNGVVLEHPYRSQLWPHCQLPEPGQVDQYGGFTFITDQHWFGHKARKLTRLYIVGIKPSDIPDYPLSLKYPEFKLAIRNGETGVKEIWTKDRESTPKEFAEFLMEIQKRVGQR